MKLGDPDMGRRKKKFSMANIGIRVDPRLKKVLYSTSDNTSRLLREVVEEYAKKKGLKWDE